MIETKCILDEVKLKEVESYEYRLCLTFADFRNRNANPNQDICFPHPLQVFMRVVILLVLFAVIFTILWLLNRPGRWQEHL